MSSEFLQGREVIIELVQVGHFVKATAMDVVTMTEASIQGPASAPEAVLRANAIRRLEYVLRKKGLIS